MSHNLLRTALIYDFDGTLARGYLQDRDFIPKVLEMPNKAFWREVKCITNREDADEILVYMHLMIEKAKERGKAVSKATLREHGKNADLYKGLRSGAWFDRIDSHAHGQGLCPEHYIISSGVEEMIRGCPIICKFRDVFASKFIYDKGNAAWPGVAINYTTKTQYLFRINKGIDNHWNNDDLNKYMAEDERRIPFKRMIFIGDGFTDIPAMKMMTHQGGCAIAVYDPDRTERDLNKIHQLIADRRVDFVAPADYSKESQLDIIVKGVLSRIGRETA